MATARFITKQLAATNIYTFDFQTENPYIYTSGQFVELTLLEDYNQKNALKLRHEFTLSSSPTEKYLSVTTRIDPHSQSLFKSTLFKLASGSNVNISEPLGDFVLPKLPQTRILFVAIGIGITPVRSIAKWLGDTKEERCIKLIYAVDNENEILFKPDIDKAGIQQTIIVKKPSPAWGGIHGKISPKLILGLDKQTKYDYIYISGPESVAEEQVSGLIRLGFPQSRIVTDYFLGLQK